MEIDLVDADAGDVGWLDVQLPRRAITAHPDGTGAARIGVDELDTNGVAEIKHGRELLDQKLTGLGGPKLVFSFKKAVVALVGRFDGNGSLTREFAVAACP